MCLQNPIPTSKQGVEPKRPGRPVDITSFCRLSPTMPNQIDVSWATDFGRVRHLSLLFRHCCTVKPILRCHLLNKEMVCL